MTPDSHPTAPSAPQETDTGLPGLRSWRTVYWVVLGVFALWVALLTWLTKHFA